MKPRTLSTSAACSPQSPASRYAKASAVAQLFGVSRRTLSRWAEAKKISRYKLSARAVAYDVAELEAFFASHRS